MELASSGGGGRPEGEMAGCGRHGTPVGQLCVLQAHETWRRLFWGKADCDLELGAVALADGVAVGVTVLSADRE